MYQLLLQTVFPCARVVPTTFNHFHTLIPVSISNRIFDFVLDVHSFAGFFVVSLALIVIKNLGPQFLLYHIDHRTTNQLEISCSTWKTPSETLRFMQDMYGDDTILRAQAVEWHRRLRKGWEDVKDYPRSERPATSTTEENVELVR